MTNHRKKDDSALTLVDAIETLSNIADLQFDREIGLAQLHDLVLNDKELSYRTVHWVREEGADETLKIVKDTFRVILSYLKEFYKRKYAQVSYSKSVEGVKTIMILVGEAARKLDNNTSLQSWGYRITDLKEYKQLQEFYLSHIAKKIDEGTISKWILALARKGLVSKSSAGLKGKRPILTKHVFIDLESVKKDSEYELFFLKKEDGTRFFSPRLIRNIKLVNDFGSRLGRENEGDPLLKITDWQDEVANTSARNIIRSLRSHIEKFYKTIVPRLQAREHELIDLVHKALIALMMAAHPVHDLQTESKKCWNYFHDFQLFLRRALQSTEYQKLMAYSTVSPSSKQMSAVVNLVHFICLALYTQLNGYSELFGKVHELIHQATENLSRDHKEAFKDANKLWAKLAGNYAIMSKLLNIHASGPLSKILTVLEDGESREFDPILQGNLPSQLYSLYSQDNRIQFARWPSPTYQEFINKAAVNEEFKGFLYGCAHEPIINKVLIINFQDRTSWKEQERCKVVEDIPNHESFTRHIEVVSLDKDTEFYHQLGPYAQNNHADVFIKNLKEQIDSEDDGYCFPPAVRKELHKFIPETIEAIHRVFFSNKNILLRENRLDFIEIFYLFLQLKIIECLKPDIVGFSCKDGLDVTSAAAAELFIFLKFLNQEHLSENDQDHLDLMLYGPCMISRERIMMADRFERMSGAIKAIESARDQIGRSAFIRLVQEVFGYFYKSPILKGKVVVHDSKDIF